MTVDYLSADGNTYTVSVDLSDANIPEGAYLQVEELSADEAEEYIKEAAKAVDTKVKDLLYSKALDISIIYNNEKIQPDGTVKVEVELQDKKKDILSEVVHFGDKAEVLEAATNGSTVEFETDGFSVFAIVGTETIAARYITAEGDTYNITVTYGPEAGIPKGAHLSVAELEKTDSRYSDYKTQTAEALSSKEDRLTHFRLFDIKILSEKNEVIEPTAPVSVKIEYAEPIRIQNQMVSVLHFGKEKTDVIEPEVKGEKSELADEFAFETDSFSVYAVTTYGVNENLDGKTLAIVKVSNTGVDAPVSTNVAQTNKVYKLYYGAALQHTARGLNVFVDQRATNRYLVTGTPTEIGGSSDNPAGWSSNTDTVDLWTFEKVQNSENQYYIKAASGDSEGKYLTLTPENGVALSDEAQPLTVTAITESGRSRVTISGGEGSALCYLCSQYTDNQGAITVKESTFSAAGTGTTGLTSRNRLTLCDIRSADYTSPEYSAEKISVQELKDYREDQSPYVIFKNVYNPVTESYESYAIDGNGDLVYAYEKGDSITMHSALSPLWQLTFSETDGYYVFVNVGENSTGKYLRPYADGSLVCDSIDDFAAGTPGVQLPGRSSGGYTSGIQYWNDSVNAYRGYEVTVENGVAGLKVAAPADAMDFSFAKVIQEEENTLHPVGTVDSVAAGITIHMFDYPNKATIDNILHNASYLNNELKHSHVGYTLGTDGYPKFYSSELHSGVGASTSSQSLFNPVTGNSYYMGDANHLFIDSVYESTGYYEYESFNNYAYWQGPAHGKTTPARGDTYDFIVYEEIGTSGSHTTQSSGVAGGTGFVHRIGEYYPYNPLSKVPTSDYLNLYGSGSVPLDYEDPIYGDKLHEVIPIKSTGDRTTGGGGADYYHAMTMDFKFLMPHDGRLNGNPMIYEFNGDDDLYVFVDGVLLLDIGGVHDAWPGSINFSTGEIWVQNYSERSITIKSAFKRAGVFPDGTAWNDALADNYFNGNTFKDFTGHEFKMYYMEHGANASNLELRFNIPAVEPGKFTVKKELMGTDQQRYANVPFAYKAYKKLSILDEDYEEGKYKPITSDAIYGMKVQADGTVKDVSGDAVHIEFDDNGIFYLKPGETAIFTQPESETYYVEEIGIGETFSQLYPRVYINNTEVEGAEGAYRCADDTVFNRPLVVFKNECGEYGINDLKVTKELSAGTPDNGDMFEYRVLLESTGGTLYQYTVGAYYVLDPEDNYCKYEGGEYVSVASKEEADVFHAGEYGTIARIPAGYSFVIEDILAGTHFYVDEIRVNEQGVIEGAPLITSTEWRLVDRTRENADDATAAMKDSSIYSYFDGPNTPISSQIGENGFGVLGRIKEGETATAQVTFTNKYSAAHVALKKVKEDGTTTISGAAFDLAKSVNGTWSDVQTGIRPGAAEEGKPPVENPVDLGELPVGRYRLTETQSPDGYIILRKYIYFEVYRDKDNDNKVKIRFTDENGTQLTEEQIRELADTAVIESPAEGDDLYTLTIINNPGTVLPETGGSGTLPYRLSGLMLILFAALMYGFRMRYKYGFHRTDG